MKRIINLIPLLFFIFSMVNAQPGSVDWSFQPDFNCSEGSGSIPHCPIAVQRDGKVISGGNCSINLFNGKKQSGIFRLNRDGTLDTGFKTGIGIEGIVEYINIFSNDKILVTGYFNNFNGVNVKDIVLLNSDGSLDSTFHSPYSDGITQIFAITIQTDDKIVIYGNESVHEVNDVLIRLHKNGSVDSTFKKTKINSYAFLNQSLRLMPNGDVILLMRNGLKNYWEFYKVNSNGIAQSSFKLDEEVDIYAFGEIEPLKDGKIMLVGTFNTHQGLKGVLRFNSDGTLDKTFINDRELKNSESIRISSCLILRNNKIILGVTSKNDVGSITNKLIRLNTNGSFDTTFRPDGSFNEEILEIQKYNEEKIIVGGDFSGYNTSLISRIARINNADASEELNFTISPNPAAGIFKLNASQSLKRINITDAIGKEILRIEPMAYDITIDLSDLATGIYFIKAFSESSSKCLKVLKK